MRDALDRLELRKIIPDEFADTAVQTKAVLVLEAFINLIGQQLTYLKSVTNNLQNRIPLLTALLSLHPRDYVYPRLLGDELLRESRTSEAMISYHLGIELDPSNTVGTPIDEINHAGVICATPVWRLGHRRI